MFDFPVKRATPGGGTAAQRHRSRPFPCRPADRILADTERSGRTVRTERAESGAAVWVFIFLAAGVPLLTATAVRALLHRGLRRRSEWADRAQAVLARAAGLAALAACVTDSARGEGVGLHPFLAFAALGAVTGLLSLLCGPPGPPREPEEPTARAAHPTQD
ncbi:hypothetical protein OG429_27930 [Streptomyces sp. NBC_00190]|uniref:hypothetical protein n=1 Tax=Streptomyces sp. NBC_00190 TaxID=2903634 RepID=UPI002E2D5958|nr:hypothetical protein [Streptomyces sp. NBC_00190]